MKNKGYNTKAIHGGETEHNEKGAHATPIYQTSTFVFKNVKEGGDTFAGKNKKYAYSRMGNPTNTVLEEKLALLEGGEACRVYGSGMGAIAPLVMSLVKAGDHMISSKTLYGCTDDLFSKEFPDYGIEIDFVDTFKAKNVKDVIRAHTKLIYLESPANPTMDVADIAEICKIAKRYGIPVAVDNTFATPYNQRPLELGADIVIEHNKGHFDPHSNVRELPSALNAILSL